MKFSEIARKIEQKHPNADTLEVVRIATLMSTQVCDLEQLRNDEYFTDMWDEINLRLHAATDQHEAVTDELEQLASSDPKQFTQDQIWVLIRAIKVQSQVLRMYIGDPSLELN